MSVKVDIMNKENQNKTPLLFYLQPFVVLALSCPPHHPKRQGSLVPQVLSLMFQEQGLDNI